MRLPQAQRECVRSMQNKGQAVQCQLMFWSPAGESSYPRGPSVIVYCLQYARYVTLQCKCHALVRTCSLALDEA